jgi:hypothetical protein
VIRTSTFVCFFSGAELEVNALNRRIQGLEEDLEKSEDKLLIASQKLDKAGIGLNLQILMANQKISLMIILSFFGVIIVICSCSLYILPFSLFDRGDLKTCVWYQASTAADDSERMRKVLENRAIQASIYHIVRLVFYHIFRIVFTTYSG